MRNRIKALAAPLGLGLALAATAASTQAAVLLNGGFETHDFTGWTANGFVDVVFEAVDAVATPPFGQDYFAVEGAFFAQLTAGVDLGVYTTFSQAFDLTATSTISGFAAFLAFDYGDYDDDGYVKIIGPSGDLILFASSVSAVGDYGHTDWTHFLSGPLAAGHYTIEAGVRDVLDFGGSSQLLLDNVTVTAVGVGAVPEPAVWLLMLAGFGLVGALARRRAAACA